MKGITNPMPMEPVNLAKPTLQRVELSSISAFLILPEFKLSWILINTEVNQL